MQSEQVLSMIIYLVGIVCMKVGVDLTIHREMNEKGRQNAGHDICATSSTDSGSRISVSSSDRSIIIVESSSLLIAGL